MKKFLSAFLPAAALLAAGQGYADVLSDGEKCADAMKNEHYSVAAQQCGTEAEAGDPAAAEILGYIYLKGKSGLRDWDLAKKYLEMAVDGGNITASKYLAVLYWNGLGVERDQQKAMELFADCINYENEHGGVTCKVQLASTLSFGTNSRADHENARDIYRDLVDGKDYGFAVDLAKMDLNLEEYFEAYKYAEFYIWWAKRYGTVSQIQRSMSEGEAVKNAASAHLSDAEVNEAFSWVKERIFAINNEVTAQRAQEKAAGKDESAAGSAAAPETDGNAAPAGEKAPDAGANAADEPEEVQAVPGGGEAAGADETAAGETEEQGAEAAPDGGDAAGAGETAAGSAEAPDGGEEAPAGDGAAPADRP